MSFGVCPNCNGYMRRHEVNNNLFYYMCQSKDCALAVRDDISHQRTATTKIHEGTMGLIYAQAVNGVKKI